MRPRAPWLLALLLSACPAPPEQEEEGVAMPSSTTPGVARLDPVQREVVAPTHRAHVDALRFVEAHAGEGARVEVDLTLFLALPVEFDGLQTAARGVTFERSRVLLRVDGEDLPAVPQEGEARWVQIPPSGARRVQVTFVFAVDARPADAVLRMQVESAWSALRLIGPPRLDDGRQAVDVLAVDPAGRAPRAAGLLEVDGEEVTREAPVLPWRGPAGQGARLSVEGFEPVDLALGDGPVQVVHLVPDTPAGALQASFADLWRDLPLPSPPPLMPELIAQLHTPEEALEAVRDGLGVLPYTGIRRSPDGVLRLGAGSPEERAVVLVELVKAQGHQARLACGELPAAQVAAVLAPPAAPAALPAPLADWVAADRQAVDALQPALQEALATHPSLPSHHRLDFRLVPEWCWVEYREDEDADFKTLDLRPPPWDATPLPFLWRTTVQVWKDAWTVHVSLQAAVRAPDGGVGGVLVASHRGTVAAVSDASMVFALDPLGRDRASGMVAVADTVQVDGRPGEELDLSTLESLALEVRLLDPDGLETAVHVLPLWHRNDRGEPAVPLRVVLTTDGGSADGSDVALWLRQAVDGAHPDPGLAAELATHALGHLLRRHVGRGVEGTQPDVLVSVHRLDAEGGFTRTFEHLSASMPAWIGADGPDLAARARRAAVDAVTRARLAGVPAPGAPKDWLLGSQDMGSVRVRLGDYHALFARMLPVIDVGQGEDATWRLTRGGAAPAWWSLYPVPTGLPAATPEPTPKRPHLEASRRWSVPLQCLEAARWGGGTIPDGC